VGLVNFLVMMGAFTTGVSVVALVIGAAKRIGAGGAGGAAHAVRELHDEVELLRAELDQLRSGLEETKSRFAALDEVQNRLDFAERALVQMKPRDALPGPR
jgi:hypothetical protein